MELLTKKTDMQKLACFAVWILPLTVLAKPMYLNCNLIVLCALIRDIALSVSVSVTLIFTKHKKTIETVNDGSG